MTKTLIKSMAFGISLLLCATAMAHGVKEGPQRFKYALTCDADGTNCKIQYIPTTPIYY